MLAAEAMQDRATPGTRPVSDRWLDVLCWLAVIAVAALAVGLRLAGIEASSLTVDEATLVEFAKGVLERGYPFVYVGTMEVPLATYELLPYPIALSMLLFGSSEFAVRLPAIVFSAGTTVLLFSCARLWFDRRVAVLASLLYAVSPLAIYWGGNCFHPAQVQVLTLLTLRCAYPWLRNDSVPARDYYLAGLCFIAAFLSWEGIGFLLPVLFTAAIVVNRGRWQWLMRKHLWIMLCGVGLVVVSQGIRRVLLQVTYLQIGSGKSEVSLPQPAFTHADYDPWYYLSNFFGLDSHVLLSPLFFAGLLFLRRNDNLRFVYAVVLGAVFFLTNFLPFSNAHYVYWLLPLFLMAASSMLFIVGDELLGARMGQLVTARLGAAFIAFALVAVTFATASPFGLKLYEIALLDHPERRDTRVGLLGVDYRRPLEAFKQDLRPGDVVISFAPFPMDFYAGTKGDYFVQSLTWQKVVYDPGAASPRYVDHYAGNPVLRSRAELQDLLSRNERVWLYAAPYDYFRKIQDRELIELVDSQMRVISESYDSRLYLWSR